MKLGFPQTKGNGKGDSGDIEPQIKSNTALLLGLDSNVNGNEFLRFATSDEWNYVQSFEATSTNPQAANLSLGAGCNSHLCIDTDGNVGIGTTSPDEKLHVNGAIILGDRDGTEDNTLWIESNVLKVKLNGTVYNVDLTAT